MVYRNFCGLNEDVSIIGYGTMGLGGAFGSFNEKEAIRSIHTSIDKGVNFFDTARHYGNSEEILGKALKHHSGKRPIIASKIQSHGAGNTRWAIPPPIEDTFPKNLIRKDVEESLLRLQVDCIDIMQLHLYWPVWGTTGYWLDELLKLKEEGKIRAIGISTPDHRHDVALPLVMSGNIDCVQTIINIFDPLALDCLVPICASHRVSIIARCVLDEGGLTGFLNESTTFEENDFRKSYFEELPRSIYMNHVNDLKKYIPAQASSLAKLAIKFVLKDPNVTTAITSMHLEKFAQENIGTIEEPTMSEDVFYELYTRHRWVNNLYHSKYWSGTNDLDKANNSKIK